MSPYLFTLLADEAALVLFGLAVGLAAGVAARRGHWALAGGLGGAAVLMATGLAPVLGSLLRGDLLADRLPGLAMAEVVPYGLLTVAVLLRPAPGPRDAHIDPMALVGLGLAAQGLPGFALGLALLARRWLAPGPHRRWMIVAIAALGLAALVDARPRIVRATLGGGLGLSTDASVRLVHLVVSFGELAGWLGIGWVIAGGSLTTSPRRTTSGAAASPTV